MDCAILEKPGNYALLDMAPASENATTTPPVIFYDPSHTLFGQAQNGQLKISTAENDLISGSFEFDLSNPAGEISIKGSFHDMPWRQAP